MLLYYIVTAPNMTHLPGFIVVTVILHVFAFIMLVILAKADPGIIRKILPNY